jgi:hypothetical protein
MNDCSIGENSPILVTLVDGQFKCKGPKVPQRLCLFDVCTFVLFTTYFISRSRVQFQMGIIKRNFQILLSPLKGSTG